MKIGTHNSLSYLRPRQWWLWPFAWVGRCQSLNIEQQWNAGVRYFDIRIRFRKDRVISGHGLINYNINVWDVIKYLNECGECYVRLMLEEKGMKDDMHFKALVSAWKNYYPNIHFTSALRKEPYEVLVPGEKVEERHCYKHFQDYGAKTIWQKIKGFRFPCPWYWAKKDNAKYLAEANKSVFTIVDFVNVKGGD